MYGQNAVCDHSPGMTKAQVGCAGVALTWAFVTEPLIGIEPMTYSLRVNRSGRLS
jgi:hypothetical protein